MHFDLYFYYFNMFFFKYIYLREFCAPSMHAVVTALQQSGRGSYRIVGGAITGAS